MGYTVSHILYLYLPFLCNMKNVDPAVLTAETFPTIVCGPQPRQRASAQLEQMIQTCPSGKCSDSVNTVKNLFLILVHPLILHFASISWWLGILTSASPQTFRTSSGSSRSVDTATSPSVGGGGGGVVRRR